MPPSRQRLAVQEALHALDHPSADEVFRHVRKRMPRVSLATVYRNLDGLVDEDQAGVREVGGQRRYDANLQPHIHLHCTRCDRLVDTEADPGLDASLAHLAGKSGYDFEESLVEVRGVCPACKDSRPRPDKEMTP